MSLIVDASVAVKWVVEEPGSDKALSLFADEDDLAREKRKFLTAKVASSEWDGIIVTHSSFERIGMSCGYQERFLREQIAEYEKLMCEHARCRGDDVHGAGRLARSAQIKRAAAHVQCVRRGAQIAGAGQ